MGGSGKDLQAAKHSKLSSLIPLCDGRCILQTKIRRVAEMQAARASIIGLEAGTRQWALQ